MLLVIEHHLLVRAATLVHMIAILRLWSESHHASIRHPRRVCDRSRRLRRLQHRERVVIRLIGRHAIVRDGTFSRGIRRLFGHLGAGTACGTNLLLAGWLLQSLFHTLCFCGLGCDGVFIRGCSME